MQTKIATCCYCGTRAALVLKGKERHELACSACGAPLHDLKIMPAPKADRPKPKASKPVNYKQSKPEKKPKKPKKSKRKSSFSHFLGEAWDVIDDIFD